MKSFVTAISDHSVALCETSVVHDSTDPLHRPASPGLFSDQELW